MAALDPGPIAHRLPPHPLIVGLTARRPEGAGAVLASRVAVDAAWVDDPFAAILAAVDAEVQDAQNALGAGGDVDAQARAANRANEANRAQAAVGPDPAGQPVENAIDIFTAAAGQYTLVAGYVGGCWRGGGDDMVRQVLFVTAKLASWLLVPLDDIQLFNRIEDDRAPFGVRDILWLRPDTRVVQGQESDSVPRSYLNGPFIRADELASSARTGTYARTGGLLDEAITPGCCPGTHWP
jgi:hypothetical protein